MTTTTSEQLIITSGDVSDVDGFFALAEYAKTGADVLYVMNYPAYLDGDSHDDEDEDVALGLGFRYGVERVDAQTSAERMKRDFTNLAFTMATNVWNEASPLGRLLFMIGGVNQVNPFSPQAVKNELVTFASFVSTVDIDPEPGGALYDAQGRILPRALSATEIYVDFNGSMAFFDADAWLVQALLLQHKNVKGAFIMGGVEANKPPQTMPAIAGRLNRLSCATMNQLYHPPNTARLFQFLASHKIPAYIVSNNAVASLDTDDNVHRFLSANWLHGEYLGRLARAYYATGAPRKPFDMYTAVALRGVLAGGLQRPTTAMRLFYSGELGISLLGSESLSWEEALAAYARGIDLAAAPDDSDFVRAKKQSFRRELELLRKVAALPSLSVMAPTFVLDPESCRLVA